MGITPTTHRFGVNLLTALSLLLCVASAAVMIRSCRAIDYLGFSDMVPRGNGAFDGTQWACTFDGGAAFLGRRRDIYPIEGGAVAPAPQREWSWDTGPVTGRNRGTFLFQRSGGTMPIGPGSYRTVSIGFPLWLPAAIFALRPAARL